MNKNMDNIVDNIVDWLDSDDITNELAEYNNKQKIYEIQRYRYIALWKTLTKTQRTNILRKLSAFDYHDNKYINIMYVIDGITDETNMFKKCDFLTDDYDESEMVYDIDGIALYHVLSVYGLSKITMLDANDIVPHICEDITMNIYYNGRVFWTGTNKATTQDICNQIINKHLTGYTIWFSNELDKKYEINKYFLL